MLKWYGTMGRLLINKVKQSMLKWYGTMGRLLIKKVEQSMLKWYGTMGSLFSEQFPDLIDMCNSLRGQICILGDMNIHYDCPDHPLTAKTLDMLYMYNFKQVV